MFKVAVELPENYDLVDTAKVQLDSFRKQWISAVKKRCLR